MSVIETFAAAVVRYNALDEDGENVLENTDYVAEDSDVTTPNSCCDGSCPEVADVTIEEITNNIELAGALNVAVANTSDTVNTVTMWLEDEDGNVVVGLFEFSVRLVENSNNTDEVTGMPPTSPGWAQAVVHSDVATGVATIVFENTGADDVWYVVVSFAGSVATPVDINIGV